MTGEIPGGDQRPDLSIEQLATVLGRLTRSIKVIPLDPRPINPNDCVPYDYVDMGIVDDSTEASAPHKRIPEPIHRPPIRIRQPNRAKPDPRTPAPLRRRPKR